MKKHSLLLQAWSVLAEILNSVHERDADLEPIIRLENKFHCMKKIYVWMEK